MRFAELVQGTVDDAALIGEINCLLAVKMCAGNAATSPRWEGLHGFIVREFEVARQHAPEAGPRLGIGTLNDFLRSCLRCHGASLA